MEAQIIQKFADAASTHPSVNWFDSGTAEFLFSKERQIDYPVLFVQSTDGSSASEQTVLSFTLYALDLPNTEVAVSNTAFQWDKRLTEARDKTQQIIQDIVGTVTLENQQDYLIELTGTLLHDSTVTGDGAVGWRADITVTFDSPATKPTFS